jgi:hypothetical protein
MKIKRAIKIIIIVLTSLIVGIYIGNGYAHTVQHSQIKTKLNDCTTNIDKINWSSLLVIDHHIDKNQLILAYTNKSECFNFESITTELIIYRNGIPDTASITLKEIVKANKKLTIYIKQPNADSVKILQSIVNQKSLNF